MALEDLQSVYGPTNKKGQRGTGGEKGKGDLDIFAFENGKGLADSESLLQTYFGSFFLCTIDIVGALCFESKFKPTVLKLFNPFISLNNIDANECSCFPTFSYAFFNFVLKFSPFPKFAINLTASLAPAHAAWFKVPVSILYGDIWSWTIKRSVLRLSNIPGLEYKNPRWGP